jgi:NAD(P)-dependent dehydrogenase (short-subunit alcohol dehydrogenase family)
MHPYLNHYSLDHKVAIVTGAGQGIGKAIALAFAAAGAKVGCFDLQLANAEQTAKEINAAGGQAIGKMVDVSSEDSVKQGVHELVNHFNSGLHILLNAAAYKDPSGTVADYELNEWNKVIAVNLTGAYLMSKYAIAHMRQNQGGSIIHIASQLGRVGTAGRSVYCAVKGALLNLARAMAVDHSAEGIRTNTISPGAIETDRMLLRFGTFENARKELAPLHLVGRLGQPDEIAMAAVYLASDASKFMTGSDLLIDGGYAAQ